MSIFKFWVYRFRGIWMLLVSKFYILSTDTRAQSQGDIKSEEALWAISGFHYIEDIMIKDIEKSLKKSKRSATNAKRKKV